MQGSKAPQWDRYFNGDLNERWAALNELLAAELHRANDSPELAGCSGGEKLEKPFVMGDGAAKGLNPFFTCAGQAAQAAAARHVANGERPPGWEDRWALYLSTDSPGLNQLVVGISGLHGHVVSGRRPLQLMRCSRRLWRMLVSLPLICSGGGRGRISISLWC